MKTQTHIATHKQMMLSNKEQVMRVLGLNELEYSRIIYEAGDEFLHQEFPIGTEFEPFKAEHERHPLYWKWFRSEYALIEQQLITNYNNYLIAGFPLDINTTLWQTTVGQITSTDHFRTGFKNYLKTLRSNEKRTA